MYLYREEEKKEIGKIKNVTVNLIFFLFANN